MRTPSLSDTIATFITDTSQQDITQAAAIVRRAYADTVACAIAGSRTPHGKKVRAYAQSVQGQGSAFYLDGSGMADPSSVALVNGTWSHAHDFDDTNHPLYGHPSCHLVPTALALAGVSAKPLSGRELVVAYLTGHQVEVAIAYGMNMGHYRKGFHATGTLGSIGAAATAAKALKLNHEACRNAIGLAASMASGLRANVGSEAKPLHAGLAARSGAMAALLARDGFESSTDALDGELGFCFTYQSDSHPTDMPAIRTALERRWLIQEPYGQQIKPFPACGATHPAIEAALEVRDRLHRAGRGVDEITRVDIAGSALAPEILVYREPQSGNNGKFSLDYTVARAFASGWPTLEDFTDEAVRESSVVRLGRLVEYRIDPDLATDTEFGVRMTVHLNDGETMYAEVPYAVGKNARPMSDEQLRTKVRDCLRFATKDPVGIAPEPLVDQLFAVTDAPDLASFTKALLAHADGWK